MGMLGPNSRALQMDLTLLHYASAITEQKKKLGVDSSKV